MYASDRISPTSYLSRMFSIVSHGDLRFLILDCPSDSTLPSVIKILTKEGVTDVVRVCEPTYATGPLTSLGIQVHDLSFKDGGVPPHSVLAKFMALVEQRFHHKTLPPGFVEHQMQANGNTGTASAPSSPTAVAAEPSPSASFSRPASLRSATSTDSTDHPHGHAHVGGAASSSLSTSTSSQPSHAHAPTTIAVHCVAGLGRAPILVAVALIEHGMSPLDAIEYVRARRRGAFNTTQVKYLDAYKPQFRLHDGSSKRQGSGRGSPRLFASLGQVVSGGRRSVTGSPEPGAGGNGENAGGKADKEKAESISGTGGWGDAVKHKFGKLVGGLAKKRSGSAMAAPAKSATDLAVHP